MIEKTKWLKMSEIFGTDNISAKSVNFLYSKGMAVAMANGYVDGLFTSIFLLLAISMTYRVTNKIS